MRTPFQRLRFQGKLLVPVFAMMVMLIIATLWVVYDRITRQVQTEVAASLSTADAVFRNNLKIREKYLLLRYRDVPNEPRFKAIMKLGEPKTMQFRLTELVETLGVDIIFYTTPETQPLAIAMRENQYSASEVMSNTVAATGRALEGQTAVDMVAINGQLFEVVSIPVKDGANLIGALTFATEFGEGVANEFRQLTRSEIVFLSRGQITATTLRKKSWQWSGIEAFRSGNTLSGIHPVTIGGEHFLGLPGQFNALTSPDAFGYLLLVSYERSLVALQNTQESLLLVGLLGLALSTLITWMVVRKLTEPLRQLRDSAEAVGRGDFSRRVEIRADDECGELATAFNRMTANLSSAREELEKTVDTLKTTRAQLTQSEKLSAIGEFVAGVAHELNNPLTTVVGYAELLQRAKIDERYRKQLEMVESEAHRCHRIVQSLLSFARRHKPERKTIQINDVVRAGVELLAYQLRTSNVEMRLNLAPQLPQVVADIHQLQQVIVNIVNNARQAITELHRGGWIAVTTEVVEERVIITIQDNGPGISEENLVRIFDPFFTTKEVGQGTGLGLSLCYGIVQEHGGTIKAQSQLGQGATFVIDLPVVKSGAVPDTRQTSSFILKTVKATGTGKRVLVVDDEPMIVELIRQVLIEDNFDVDVAGDGQTALHRARQQHYDLILCDWKMPGLTGQEVYEQLVTADPKAAARFIFMTGDVINERSLEFLQNNLKTCLAKPFSVEEFRRVISEAVK